MLVYGPEGTLRARLGANGGDGSSGRGPGEFNHPRAVALDAAGDVYVADTANNRIVKLSPEGAQLRRVGLARQHATGTSARPTGVAVDARGARLRAGQRKQPRAGVRRRRPDCSRSGGCAAPAWAFFSQPTAIAVGCAGDVYVADTNNNRVERFEPAAPRRRAGCVSAVGVAAAARRRAGAQRAPAPQRRRARAPGARADVSCERGCKVLASATLAPYGRRGAVPLQAAARSLPRNVAGHLRLRVGARAYRRLRGALGRARLMRAQVTIVAAGPTGRRTTLHRSYIVGR